MGARSSSPSSRGTRLALGSAENATMKDMGVSQTKTFRLPDGLMAEVENAAQIQKRSVEEVLAEAVQQYLDKQEFEKTLSFGNRHAKSRGLTPADVPRAITRAREERGRLWSG